MEVRRQQQEENVALIVDFDLEVEKQTPVQILLNTRLALNTNLFQFKTRLLPHPPFSPVGVWIGGLALRQSLEIGM